MKKSESNGPGKRAGKAHVGPGQGSSGKRADGDGGGDGDGGEWEENYPTKSGRERMSERRGGRFALTPSFKSRSPLVSIVYVQYFTWAVMYVSSSDLFIYFRQVFQRLWFLIPFSLLRQSSSPQLEIL